MGTGVPVRIALCLVGLVGLCLDGQSQLVQLKGHTWAMDLLLTPLGPLAHVGLPMVQSMPVPRASPRTRAVAAALLALPLGAPGLLAESFAAPGVLAESFAAPAWPAFAAELAPPIPWPLCLRDQGTTGEHFGRCSKLGTRPLWIPWGSKSCT